MLGEYRSINSKINNSRLKPMSYYTVRKFILYFHAHIVLVTTIILLLEANRYVI